MNAAVLVAVLAVAAQGRVTRPFRPCQDLQSCLCSDSKLMVMACEGTELTHVPLSRYSQSVAYLALSDNRIATVPSDAFSTYSHVKAMYLSNAGIHAIHQDAFKQVPELKELDLSFNPLGELHPDTFAGNPLLQTLVLMANEFLRLPEGPILASRSLAKLDLSYCGIGRLPPDAFARLPNLIHVDLASNKLVSLAPATLKPLPLLEELRLEGNEWRCGCDLHRLLGWTEVLHGRPAGYRPATCVAENGKDMMLWSLDEQGKLCVSQEHVEDGLAARRSGTEKLPTLLQVGMQETTSKAHESSKPGVVYVSNEGTAHEQLEKQTPKTGIKIFNSMEPEIIFQNYEPVDEHKNQMGTEVNERQRVGNSKPERISLGHKQSQHQSIPHVEKQSDNNFEAGALTLSETNFENHEQDEDGSEQSIFTSSTFEIILIVVLICVTFATVVLTGLLMMYAVSAGRSVVYRLMRSDSQDSSRYESTNK